MLFLQSFPQQENLPNALLIIVSLMKLQGSMNEITCIKGYQQTISVKYFI